MSRITRRTSCIPDLICLSLLAALLGLVPSVQARVTTIAIDTVTSPAFDGDSYGNVGQYETIEGRAFGELDPNDPLNAIIQDIELAPRNANGNVEYEATFFVVKPIDMSKNTGLLWHFVPNRGGRLTLSEARRADGDMSLSSGWQGDNSGRTSHDRPGREFVKVPIATHPDGSPISGKVMGRIINPQGTESSEIFVHSNPLPYKPANLNPSASTLTVIEWETYDGQVGASHEVPSSDWRWARCNKDGAPDFPGTPDPTQICVKDGFEPDRVYQVVFTAQDPYVLGIGFAAFRDVGSFFKNELEDDGVTLNPLGDHVSWILSRGSSQSGTFLRQFLHLGFNQDEAGRQVQDGMWPWVAGRRIGMNFRFAMPDGVMKIYEPGTEGPIWWSRYSDRVRGLPKRGIVDRCKRSKTCPKIIEHFGAAEVWGQKLTTGWVGTDAKKDIKLPKFLRRYYIPGTDHGGGPGEFNVTPLPAGNCPSVGYGRGTFARNPVPHTETRNAIEFHFRNWVMHDILPPPSRWPRLKDPNLKHDKQGKRNKHTTLVAATKEAMGFPSIPGVPATLPSDFINPFFDYDFGPDFNYSDTSGVQTVVPPVIKKVIPMLVPRVDADGNEMGGVPVVLHEAPLGTYLGWNIVAEGFHKGTICGYEGGMIAFANTRAERVASGDPRLSLEERYGDHQGYVNAVRAAAAHALAEGFLLPDDAAKLIAQAEAGNVLNP